MSCYCLTFNIKQSRFEGHLLVRFGQGSLISRAHPSAHFYSARMSSAYDLYCSSMSRKAACMIFIRLSMIKMIISNALYLYRSTIVHSNTVPPKEQQNYAFLKDQKNAEEAYKNSRDNEGIHVNLSRTMQTPQRISLGTVNNF